MNKHLKLIIPYNSFLFFLILLFFIKAQHDPGNHWVLFGTQIDYLLSQWGIYLVLLVNIPNFIYAMIYLLQRKILTVLILIVTICINIKILLLTIKVVID